MVLRIWRNGLSSLTDRLAAFAIRASTEQTPDAFTFGLLDNGEL